MLPRSAVAEDRAATRERFTLDAAERGAVVSVIRVSGRPRLIQRLAALGVVPGAQLSVLKAHGPAIVSMGGARIAIGRSAAESVEIEIAAR